MEERNFEYMVVFNTQQPILTKGTIYAFTKEDALSIKEEIKAKTTAHTSVVILKNPKYIFNGKN